MIFIGIDPGKAGGFALIDGSDVIVEPMPLTDMDILEVLSFFPGKEKYAVLEHIWPQPKEGVKSAFTFGQGFGGLKMALAACKVGYELVSPQRWQGELGLKYPKGISKSDKKELGRKKAQALFPDVYATFGPRTKGKQLAISDALLLAEYARRTYVG